MKKNNTRNYTKKNLWNIDSQGNLHFSTRAGKIEKALDARSGWEKPAVAIVVMLICGILDFVVFKQLFGAILYDHVLIQWLSVIGCLVAFDLGPIYLGSELKKEYQGLRSSRLVQMLILAVFAMIFIGNLWLRIKVKDILVPSSGLVSGSIFQSTGDVAEDNGIALGYAIFSGLLPLATSIVSGAVSFLTANPLLTKIKSVRAEIVEMESDLASLNAILAEYGSDSELKERLCNEDRKLLQQKAAYVIELGFWYADYTRERIKEHGGDPASTNELSKNMHDTLLRLHLSTGDEKPVFRLAEDGRPVWQDEAAEKKEAI